MSTADRVEYRSKASHIGVDKTKLILIMLFSNAQNIPNNAQVELSITIILIETDMRHAETQLHYHRVLPFGSKVGTS